MPTFTMSNILSDIFYIPLIYLFLNESTYLWLIYDKTKVDFSNHSVWHLFLLFFSFHRIQALNLFQSLLLGPNVTGR